MTCCSAFSPHASRLLSPPERILKNRGSTGLLAGFTARGTLQAMMSRIGFFASLIPLALAGLLLGACDSPVEQVSPTATLFVLPTLPPPTEKPRDPIFGSISTPTAKAATATPTATPSPRPTVALTPPTATPRPTTESSSTPAAACVMDAFFLEDVTIPDDTVMKPGETFTKTWRMKNTGSCDWPDGVILVFLEGQRMTASGEFPVPATKARDEVDISVKLTAPTEAGMHFGLWQLETADGIPFGMQLYLRIIVEDQQTTPEIPDQDQ